MKSKLASKDHRFFRKLWETLPRYSEFSGIPFRTFTATWYHHVLPKGRYPEFRYDERNIVRVTFEEHQELELWQNTKDEEKLAYMMEKYPRVYEIKEMLLNELKKL